MTDPNLLMQQQCLMYQVIVEMEGMKAENTHRMNCSNSIAYGEDSFQLLSGRLNQIIENLRNLG